MGDVINFEEEARKRQVDKMILTMGGMNYDARNIAGSYYQLMLEDPLKAIKELSLYIDKARDINPSGIEAMAGGPNFSWTAPLLDILGVAYPILDKNARRECLTQCLYFLSDLNSFNAQNNVERINEPWLVADIVISRGLYWWGYEEYPESLSKHPTWADFYQHIESAKSAFWLALAITRPKYSSLEIRTKFYKQFPSLIDRTSDAIAAIIFNSAENANKESGTPMESSIKERLSKYDPVLHGVIKAKIQEEKWIKLPPWNEI